MKSQEFVMEKEQVKSLFDSKFIKVVDIQYEEGKHYYNATRREMEDLPCMKSDEEFQHMVPDAVSCAVILMMEDGPKLYMSYEYRYPAGRYLLSPVAGLVDEEDRERDEPLCSAARREIQEETGITVGVGDRVFVVNPLVFSTPGMSDESNGIVAVVCSDVHDLSVDQSGAVGSEKFAGYRLLSLEEARELLLRGRDEYGNFFPVYGLVVLQYFVSEQWRG